MLLVVRRRRTAASSDSRCLRPLRDTWPVPTRPPLEADVTLLEPVAFWPAAVVFVVWLLAGVVVALDEEEGVVVVVLVSCCCCVTMGSWRWPAFEAGGGEEEEAAVGTGPMGAGGTGSPGGRARGGLAGGGSCEAGVAVVWLPLLLPGCVALLLLALLGWAGPTCSRRMACDWRPDDDTSSTTHTPQPPATVSQSVSNRHRPSLPPCPPPLPLRGGLVIEAWYTHSEAC